MGQYLSWLLNTALFVLCCYLVADTANEVFAALLTPTAPDTAARPDRTPRARHSWSDREVILERNLFNASLLAPAVPIEEPPEDLEATRLPLNLLGTAAAIPPEMSWAAVEDEDAQKTVIVRVSDEIQSATVERIERRRIVLSENGVLRELALGEEDPTAIRPSRSPPRSARPPRRTASNRRRGSSAQVHRLAEGRYGVEPDDAQEMLRNPATLFSQARILPKYEDGEMVGLQVNAIKPGSLFEQVGMQNGEVITGVNGVAIDSAEESSKILQMLTQNETLEIDVMDEDGTSRTLTLETTDAR